MTTMNMTTGIRKQAVNPIGKAPAGWWLLPSVITGGAIWIWAALVALG